MAPATDESQEAASRDELSHAATLVDPTTLETRSGELVRKWKTVGFDLASASIRAGTIVDPAREQALMTAHLSEHPGSAVTSPRPRDAEEFELGPVLGEGAMGIVHLAEQRTLHRKVAIKVAKADAGEAGYLALLREARVTGALEHPNIIPVHALSYDERGRARLVMKRVEGGSWKNRLASIEPSQRLSDASLLEQLGVLERVAFAVHIAHLQGVVHRDLKPDNVLLGAFGETYVVDWGIAASFKSDGIVGLPPTSSVHSVEGTPGYMAPEMVAVEGHAIDARSDVYLLGAILHEVLTGAPPHPGTSLLDALGKSYASLPMDYPDDVPSDLQRICHRAMERSPSARFPSAAAFAEALDAFRVHRASTVLSDEAAERLSAVQDDPARSETSSPFDDTAWAAFTECRFAFRLALRNWPENRAARDGLGHVLRMMIEFELHRHAPQAAALLLRELPDSVPELAERVTAALDAQKASEDRLLKLERDADISLGLDLRLRIAAVAAAVWAVAWCLGGWLSRVHILHVSPFAWAVVCGTMAAVLFAVASSSFARLGYANEANTRLTKSAAMVFVTYAGVWSVGTILNMEPVDIGAFHLGVGVALWTAITLTVDRRWYPVPLTLAVAFGVILFWRQTFAESIGLSGTAGIIVAALRTRRTSAGSSTHPG